MSLSFCYKSQNLNVSIHHGGQDINDVERIVLDDLVLWENKLKRV